MATLQKIRERAGVLVAVVIGLAILAFIMGDLFSSGPSVFNRKRLQVAEIGGESINYFDFNDRIERLSEFYRMNYQITSLDAEQIEMIREEAWRELIRELVLGSAIKKLGIQVSDEELVSMLIGDSIAAGSTNIIMDEPHPIIRRMFTNPETGEFNRSQMISYFNAITNPVYREEKKRWIFLEDQIVDERLSQKYFNMVRKGISPSNLDARYYALESGSVVDFSFVYQNFNIIPDDEIAVSQREIDRYYNERKNHFKQDEARSIEYVVFEVTPSEDDDRNAREYIEQSVASFSRSDNPVAYVNSNSEIPYRDVNYTYSDLPEVVRDSIFNAKPDDVIGPFYDNNAYKLARITEINYLPDSVRARHILITPSMQRDDERSKAIADSLKSLLDRGQARFDQLALEFSGDQSNREIGGDLGWFREGMMVKAFNDACFHGKKSEIQVVKTNFGYHIVRVEDQSPKVKKLNVAYLIREVSPSDQTYQHYYSLAVEFRNAAVNLDKFRQACIDKQMSPRFAADFTAQETKIPGLENAREIIRWAYESEENAVSQIFDLDEQYIIVALSDVKEKGFASLSSVRTEIEVTLKKQKKLDLLAEQIREKSSGATSLEAVASALSSQVNEASKVRLSNPYISGVGFEPSVVIHALNMVAGNISEPVKGENGVFVIELIHADVPENPDIAAAKFRLNYGIESRVTYEGFQALQDLANIVDRRIRFF